MERLLETSPDLKQLEAETPAAYASDDPEAAIREIRAKIEAGHYLSDEAPMKATASAALPETADDRKPNQSRLNSTRMARVTGS